MGQTFLFSGPLAAVLILKWQYNSYIFFPNDMTNIPLLFAGGTRAKRDHSDGANLGMKEGSYFCVVCFCLEVVQSARDLNDFYQIGPQQHFWHNNEPWKEEGWVYFFLVSATAAIVCVKPVDAVLAGSL